MSDMTAADYRRIAKVEFDRGQQGRIMWADAHATWGSQSPEVTRSRDAVTACLLSSIAASLMALSADADRDLAAVLEGVTLFTGEGQ